MKRYYQTEWQGIKFSDIATLSETELAGSEFYNTFYRAVFLRYGGYDELDISWRRNKKELVDWIVTQSEPNAKVLSVGCGLGYMESYMYRKYGDKLELHVSDYASDALNWLCRELPEERIHLVTQEGNMIDKRYDLIYFCAVDYAMPTEDMVNMLQYYRTLLTTSGTCLIISASYLEERLSLFERINILCKYIAKTLLRFIGLYKPILGQFWGWLRTRSEYCELIRVAGFSKFEDGFIETPNQRTYFIKATN